jgi:ABC-type transporter Mla maintaining outer membrane lipid asymmetry ATPase subunit MlaF
MTQSTAPSISAERLVPIEWPAGSMAGLTLDIRPSNVVSIIGPDYDGKLALLKALAGIQGAESGRLALFGHDSTQLTADDWQHMRTRITCVGSDTALLSVVNAIQNILLPAQYHDLDSADALLNKAHNMLAMVGFSNEEALSQLPAMLTPAQRFQAALVRALLLGPQVLLLYYPAFLLDEGATAALKSYLLDRVESTGMALVVATQGRCYTESRSNFILFVSQGNIHTYENATSLRASVEPDVRRFLATLEDT